MGFNSGFKGLMLTIIIIMDQHFEDITESVQAEILSMHTYLCTCNVFGTLEGNTSPGQSHSLTLEVR